MTKEEALKHLKLSLKAMPRGAKLTNKKVPTNWSLGYYNGLEMGYKIAISLIEQLEQVL